MNPAAGLRSASLRLRIRTARELGAFFVHLRWHYQLFVLPAGYLLGGLFRSELDLASFVLQFFAVHLLLNGGVTAYNSTYDVDEGPIGGLEHPPALARWARPASLALQVVGLGLGLLCGPTFVAIYALTMLLSIAYSRTWPRWKGRPILSLVAVGVGTGTNTFLLGYLAGGPRGGTLELDVVVAALGVALLLLAMYPVSQIYQLDSDRRHGDVTFAVAFGVDGVRRFFSVAFPLGLSLASVALEGRHTWLGFGLFSGGLAAYGVLGAQLAPLEGRPDEYRRVMRLKYVASLSFSSLALLALLAVSL